MDHGPLTRNPAKEPTDRNDPELYNPTRPRPDHQLAGSCTKHISLASLDPLALVKLRETGRCFITVPEELFDLDYPGHYFRRIRSVSLTIPCVAGPYTTVSCTLRLLRNSLRINTARGDDEPYARNSDDQGPADDPRFVESNIPVKAIATSSGQNDSGVFELSMRDERYLPFEGAGAISSWSLELFSDLASPDFGTPMRQFDYQVISDVILHVRYTAREDSGPFKNEAIAHLRRSLGGDGGATSMRLFSLRDEFPSEWARFLNPTNPATGHVFELRMSPILFRFRDAASTLRITTIHVLARCADTGSYSLVLNPGLAAPRPPGADTMALAPLHQYAGLQFGKRDVTGSKVTVVPDDKPVSWTIRMTRAPGAPLKELVGDMFLALEYVHEG